MASVAMLSPLDAGADRPARSLAHRRTPESVQARNCTRRTRSLGRARSRGNGQQQRDWASFLVQSPQGLGYRSRNIHLARRTAHRIVRRSGRISALATVDVRILGVSQGCVGGKAVRSPATSPCDRTTLFDATRYASPERTLYTATPFSPCFLGVGRRHHPSFWYCKSGISALPQSPEERERLSEIVLATSRTAIAGSTFSSQGFLVPTSRSLHGDRSGTICRNEAQGHASGNRREACLRRTSCRLGAREVEKQSVPLWEFTTWL